MAGQSFTELKNRIISEIFIFWIIIILWMGEQYG
jgi:hypothetical protein